MRTNKALAVTPQRKRISQSERRKIIFCVLVLAVPVIQVILMYFAVNINSILLAFKNYKLDASGNLSYTWCGLDNFTSFIESVFLEGGALKKAFANSLLVASVNLFFGIPCSLLFSYYIYKKKFGYQMFNVLLFVPGIVSSIVMVILFSYFVDRAIPALFLNVFDKKVVGLLSSPNMSSIFSTLILFNVWTGFGSNVLMYSSSMGRIPPEIVEAAEIDGCGSTGEFFRITLPLIYPTISTFLVVQIAGMFGNQAALYSFFGERADPELWTIGYWFFTQTLAGRDSFVSLPVPAAGGLVFTMIVAPLTLTVRFILDRFDPQVEF
jgi:multiple sugar transport system permease protein